MLFIGKTHIGYNFRCGVSRSSLVVSGGDDDDEKSGEYDKLQFL